MQIRLIHFFTALALATSAPLAYSAGNDFSDVKAQVTKQHDEAVKRLQDWIKQVSIAAEDRGYPEGADYMIQLLKDAGFQRAERVATDGKPGVFATLDAGAPKTVGLYFMYDVKQFDPKEWSSPPTEAAIVDKPGLGKIMIGRGAVNQKGPEATFLEALHAMKAAGRKMPVNFVFVAEGEEEIGSPHFGQVVHKPEVEKALAKCSGIFMPFASQDLQRNGHDFVRGKGRGRSRAHLQRREMGPRSVEGYSFLEQSASRQPGLASGSGPQHTRECRW